MGSQEHLPLCWSSHQAEVLATFQQLLSEETFVDVTLACEGASLKAHKMILSACSPYFQNLFLENPCKHPIVIIKDTDYTVLKGIVDFMYHGGINVSPDQLSDFLKTAEALKVKGLSDFRKTTELNSESCIPLQQKNPQNVTNSSQPQNSSQQTNYVTRSSSIRQQQSNEDSQNEEHYMEDESNSFSVIEVKSEPESNDDDCYEQTVLPDYPASSIDLSPVQYSVSMPPATSEANYNHSITNDQSLKISSGHQQDILMKEALPQISDVSTQNTEFTLIQSTSEEPVATHLGSNQYSSSVSQYISVHDSIADTSKNQDVESDSLVPFEEPVFHSSNPMCESYSSRNPIIDGITGILERKSCILDKTTDIKPITLKTFEESTTFSSSNLLNQKFSTSNPVTEISEKGSFMLDKESGKQMRAFQRRNDVIYATKSIEKTTEINNFQQYDLPLGRINQRNRRNTDHRNSIISNNNNNNNGNNKISRHRISEPNVCDICFRKFSYHHHLVRHKLLHSGERPFSCEICHKTFTRKDHLQLHQRTHSNKKKY